MIELLFKNNVHHDGPNTTMRKGVKWSFLLDGVDEVALMETPGTAGNQASKRLRAKILNVNVLRMIDLSINNNSGEHPGEADRKLRIQHDPACQNFNGLALRMFEIYGHGKISAYDIITVIEYEVIK